MKRLLLFLWFSLTFIPLFSQEYGGEYNELPELKLKKALEMKTYPQDPSAGAVLLYSFGEIEITHAGTILKYIRRIKILNKSAYDEWANRALVAQKLGHTKIYGFTANLENGQIVKSEIGESQIFKTSEDKEWDKYTFTMPNVKEGSVIEYTWKTVLDFYTLPDWKFQHDIPALWSEYNLKNLIVSFRSEVRGLIKVNYEEPKGKKPHRWMVANAPAFKEEPLMPNENLLISQVKLWSYNLSWEETIQRIRVHNFFKTDGLWWDFLAPIAKDVGGGAAVDTRKRIKNLMEYLKSNVIWNGTRDYLSDDPKVVLKRKKGTSGDINLMLVSLLEKAGVTVNPILMSTRENGPIHEDIPTLHQIDYVICQAIIGSDTLYLDATQLGLRYDALPLRCLNHRGLCVPKKGSSYWVNIKPILKNKVTVDADFVLQSSGELNGKLKITTDGYSTQTIRKEYFTDKEKYYLSSINGAWQVDEMHFENENDLEKPFVELYDLTITTHADVAGNTIYMNPFLALAEESNPFKADTRKFPIDYDLPEDKTFIGKITIPEGYSVQELPKSQVMMTQGAGIKCAFSFSQTGNQIHILTRLQVNRTYFSADEYKDVKEFYALVIAKKSEQIVLRKE